MRPCTGARGSEQEDDDMSTEESPEIAGLAFEVGIEMQRVNAITKREEYLATLHPVNADQRYAFDAFGGFTGWWAFLRDVAVYLCKAKDDTEAEIDAGKREGWLDLWAMLSRAANIIVERFVDEEHLNAREIAQETVDEELGDFGLEYEVKP